MLAGLEFDDIAGVARFVQAGRPTGGGNFSLCEVALSEADRNWLLSWPQKVKPARVSHLLGHDDEAEQVALVVLWFAALYGREWASEGEIWTQVAPQFPLPLRAVLFAQGHPRQRLKWALERACYRFGLHHAFGREGGQAYYVTVFLQFGFSRQARVEDWLGGAALPTAVEILLRESAVFRQLWQSLKERRALADNPFWSERQLAATGPTARLVWWPAGVGFELELRHCFSGVGDGSYQLEGPGIWEWVQVFEGAFESETLQLEAGACEVNLTLTGFDESATSWNCTVQLWDESLPQWWDAQGKRSQAAAQAGWTALLPEGWSVRSEVKRRQDGFWLCGQGPVEVVDAQGVTIEFKALGEPLALRVNWDQQQLGYLPASVTGVVTGVPDDVRVLTDQGPLEPFYGMLEVTTDAPASLTRQELSVRLQLDRDGKRITRTLRGALPLNLISWEREGEWETFRDAGALDLTVLRASGMRFLGEFSDFGLLEGDNFVGRPTWGLPPSGLAGYGAPLRLRRGPYNSEGVKERQLVGSLVDQGLCERFEVEDGAYALKLRKPIWPSEKFFLVFWDGGERVALERVAEGPAQVDWLRGKLPFDSVFAVGLGFGHTRQGALQTRVAPPLDPVNPELSARLLRWLRLPLMGWNCRNLVAGWVKGRELEFFGPWLEESSLTLGGAELEYAEDDGWFGAIAQFVPREMTITASGARDLLLAGWRRCLRVGPGFLMGLLERGDCGQEMRWIRAQLKGGAGRYPDLAAKAAAEMGVDRKWLEGLGEIYWAEGTSADLKVALRQGAFQEWLFVEGVG